MSDTNSVRRAIREARADYEVGVRREVIVNCDDLRPLDQISIEGAALVNDDYEPRRSSDWESLLISIAIVAAVIGVFISVFMLFVNIFANALEQDRTACIESGGTPHYINGEGYQCETPEGEQP